MRSTAEKLSINELCKAIVDESIEREIVEGCKTIMQVENVFVTKIKVIKAPTFSSEELKKLHQGRAIVKTQEVARPEEVPAETQ